MSLATLLTIILITLGVVSFSAFSLYKAYTTENIKPEIKNQIADIGISRLRYFLYIILTIILLTMFKVIIVDKTSINQLYFLTTILDFWGGLFGSYISGILSIVTNLYNSKNFVHILFWVLIFVPASRRLKNANKSFWWLACPIYPIVLLILPTKIKSELNNHITKDEPILVKSENRRKPINYKEEWTEILFSIRLYFCEVILKFSKYLTNRNIEICLIVWTFIQIYFLTLGLNYQGKKIIETDRSIYNHVTKTTSLESSKPLFWTIFDGFDKVKYFYDFSELVFYAGIPILIWVVYKRYFKHTTRFK